MPSAAAVVSSLVFEARIRGWSASTAKALWWEDRSTIWMPTARALFFAASASFSDYSVFYVDDIAFAVDVR